MAQSEDGQSGGSHSIRVVVTAALLAGTSIAHVLEDFVYGIPARFGLDTATAALLVGGWYTLHIFLIVLAARDRPAGYAGNALIGAGWFLAAAVDHLGEVLFVSPYRQGLISKAFEVALMLLGLLVAAVSFVAWRSKHSQQ